MIQNQYAPESAYGALVARGGRQAWTADDVRRLQARVKRLRK